MFGRLLLLCLSTATAWAATGYWDVCGPNNLYSTDFQICCGDKIYQNYKGDVDCCNGVAFNRTTNYCFNNYEIRPVSMLSPSPQPQPRSPNQFVPIQPRAPSMPLMSSSGGVGTLAKPSSGYRCGSAVLDSSVAQTKTTLCCGNTAFDARYQLCSDFGPAPIQAAGIQGALSVSSPEKYYTCGLDQVPSSAVTSFDTAYCCGNVVYDSRYYTCTRNNAVVPQGGGSSQTSAPTGQRPSSYPPVAEGYTRVRCMTNLFDVPTNHMAHYSCCGSQAFDERYFVCTSTGNGAPRAQPMSSIGVQYSPQSQPTNVAPGPQVPANTQQSTQLNCGKRIYLFGPPSYGAYMQCCGEDVYDVRVDGCSNNVKITGGATGKK